MSTNLYFLVTVLLFVFELMYFKIAAYFQIMDEPNHRSSHTESTIRGGGIIFLIAMIAYPMFFNRNYNYFMLGLFIAGLVSFLDDLNPISYKIRILCHFVAVTLLFYQLDIFHMHTYLILLSFFIAIGIINAVNFMDGINGMTGSYAFVTLGSLLYINEYVVKQFVASDFIITAMLAVVVFNFFNFRNRAMCFAGDVGSISKAFVLIFLIAKLMIAANSISYILLLLVYGLDTVSTIIFRIFRKENIFQAHRSHYFQYLVHERKIPHLMVSAAYAVVQVLFNTLLIGDFLHSWIIVIAFTILVTYAFILIRFTMEGREKLLHT